MLHAAPRAKPKSGRVIDAHGAYLIPGLWDMHTHVYFDGTAGDGTDIVLPLFLASGITGIRDRQRHIRNGKYHRAKPFIL